MSRKALDAVVWAVVLLTLLVGGLVATLFVVMPTSLDPSELIEAGAEPWTNALAAVGAFVALFIAAVLGLALWHSRRLRALGLIVILGAVAAVGWACLEVYIDYV